MALPSFVCPMRSTMIQLLVEDFASGGGCMGVSGGFVGEGGGGKGLI